MTAPAAGHVADAPGATIGAPAPLLVAYATQTGIAELHARDTCRALQAAGVPTRLLDFDSLSLPMLHAADRALFLVSTSYDGDPPDMAEAFNRDAMGRSAQLAHLRYGLLMLGDSYYDDFCGFGRRLQRWLQASGARPLFEPVAMDDEDPAALQRWRVGIGATVLR
ncbi:flavodoxin domain-containing protein [Cognatiluteimonas weifangensis]|nr:flavodoxin domain-containing protein [Luteimonas weifangensis]